MNVYVDTVESPAGELAFAVDGEAALVALHFVEGDGYVEMEEAMEDEGFVPLRDEERTAGAREELREYYAGKRREFGLPLALVGSEWQKAVWLELTRIPYGETRSYGEIADRLGSPGAARAVGRANATNRADRLGSPGAARAVGRANATNRLPLVVPCHRVIAADGTLGGFNGGLHLKERLLAHERRVLGAGS